MSPKSVSLNFSVTDEDDDYHDRPVTFVANVDYINTDYVYFTTGDRTVAMTTEDAVAMAEFLLKELT